MLLLDEFWSHSWFNWLKLVKKSLDVLVFSFCRQPQQGWFCPTVDMSLAVSAGSVVWQGAGGPEWPCGPRKEGHGHGAHPGSPCLPPLLLKAAQVSGHWDEMGQFWVTQARALSASLGDMPCRGTAEVCQHPSMDTVLWSTWPSCCWDVSLPTAGMQSWLETLFIMKDTLPVLCSDASGACNEGPAASKTLQLSLQPHLRLSSSAQPLAAFDPAQHQDAVELCPFGTTSHPIKLLCAVISLSVVSWSFGRVFDRKLISGSKMLGIHTLLSFYSNDLVNNFASSSKEK